MEIEELRQQWIKIRPPEYSTEELESIYTIKQGNILSLLKTSLKTDLVIAVLLGLSFMIVLQVLDLRTSNFWSIFMAIVVIQHIVIFLLQDLFISRLAQFQGNVQESICRALKNLKQLRWHYRIWPGTLTTILLFVYNYLFPMKLSPEALVIIGAGLLFFVSGISEFLSARIIRSKISQLEKIQEDFADLS